MQGETEDQGRGPELRHRYQPLVAFSLNAAAEEKEKYRSRSQLPAELLPQCFVGLEFNSCFLGGKLNH